ncbi:hypothetical protein S40288_03635 [Stachybotrys chartarum IBT 40288]|nr:hypothetical protein S40288_03635 [Stachybotrys chartarum IBT 40288]
MSRVWLITGVSSGLGLKMALEALSVGEIVLGTVRDRKKAAGAVERIETLGGQVAELNMTWGQDKIRTEMQKAETMHGRIEVLVNNAGCAVVGPVEAFGEVQARKQMDTNLFGPLFTLQAVLPRMRARRACLIINISSEAGQVVEPCGGFYSASKSALESITEALALEVAEFHVSTLIVQSGAFKTNLLAPGAMERGGEFPRDYVEALEGRTLGEFEEAHGMQPGDPGKAAERVVEAVRGDGVGGRVKGVQRLLLGSDCFRSIGRKLEKLGADREACREVAEGTNL